MQRFYTHAAAAYALIDWQDVQQIVIEGLKILIVFCLLAGRYSRRLWDALPALSERLGKAYSRLLVGEPTPQPAALLRPTVVAPTIRSLRQQGLSQRAIALQLGITRYSVRKELATI